MHKVYKDNQRIKSILVNKIEVLLRPKKNICVFPITWSSKLGSVGRDDYFF